MMKLRPSNDAAGVAMRIEMNEAYRPIFAERLAEWDR